MVMNEELLCQSCYGITQKVPPLITFQTSMATKPTDHIIIKKKPSCSIGKAVFN